MSEPQIPLDDPLAPEAQPSLTTTAVLEREQVEEQLQEPGDHERFSHYVRKEKILESALSGDPVVALCGKVWVPGTRPEEVPGLPDVQGDLRRPAGTPGRRRVARIGAGGRLRRPPRHRKSPSFPSEKPERVFTCACPLPDPGPGHRAPSVRGRATHRTRRESTYERTPMKLRSRIALSSLMLGAVALGLGQGHRDTQPMAGEATVAADCATHTDAVNTARSRQGWQPQGPARVQPAQVKAMEAASPRPRGQGLHPRQRLGPQAGRRRRLRRRPRSTSTGT